MSSSQAWGDVLGPVVDRGSEFADGQRPQVPVPVPEAPGNDEM
ncbi:hypothetical protein ABZ734_27560 [Streptomyces sp. NPDC006660]